ncbi:hypothetical protein VCHA53P481_210039 [Vibrio chagasii]|nr:hypothetical protein VCHA28O22_20627 [Vibrio chagasii]CAH6995422.1 hypothetical protein VCHA50O396_130103 [Vibrio chagasii]CAH7112887.1 hypothetical protein VCHA38P215_240040 [Vibrio chagasii]CAH7133383.1 hypothetical protein VCHA49P379_220055 [Vibrio chagasii]CAH7141394.1 hypothetical protein VCHA53P481_210039 [Vibrio chagasii]
MNIKYTIKLSTIKKIVDNLD